MRNYTIALEHQLDLMHFYAGADTNPDLKEQISKDNNPWLYKSIPEVMRRAKTCYLRDDIAAQLWAAIDTLPNTACIYKEWIFEETGFVYIGGTGYALPKTAEGYTQILHAFAWHRAENGLMVWYFADVRDDNQLGMMGDWYMQVVGLSTIPYGKSISAMPAAIHDTIDVSPEHMRARVWAQEATAISFFAFASQTIAARESHGVDRATRRRYEREYNREPSPITVVTLRRQQRARTDTEGDSSAERRHVGVRYIRRGHWRNQWYPSRERHEPKWIEETICGPDGAPLKGKVTIYKIER